MTDLTIPKQMKTIITLLNLVKSELFITIDHAERCLEMFISERQSNASLQQFVQALQQIRGSLTLIEVNGATQLADLMLEKALDIPSGADGSWDNILSCLSTSIFTLRRYLENFENYPYPLPELLTPTINELRHTSNHPPLSDSYFANIKVITAPLPNPLPKEMDASLFGRLRQMYQIGLLGLIKDENREASLRMMSRSMDRLQKHLATESAARLCWVTSAALESFTDSKMTAFSTRKRLFSRVDQQLRKAQKNNEDLNTPLLKDLLYIVALDDSLGPKALTVFANFNLVPLPYNNKILESEIAKLAGPGQSAICSFTAAIREELIQTQHTIDSFMRSSANHTQLIKELHGNLEHLIKTLSLVGLQQAETMLKEQIGTLKIHQNNGTLDTSILENLADVILHVEGIIISYENNAACADQNVLVNDPAASQEELGNQYLRQGRTLAIQESLVGLGTAQQNIMAYIESEGDKQYLDKLPQLLDEIYGSLLFLNQERAAIVIRKCCCYIENEMINSNSIPDTHQLDTLADILTSLEFFMETGSTGTADNKVLDLAEESLATLNIPETARTAPQPAPKPTVKPVKEPPIVSTVVEKPILSQQVLETNADDLTYAIETELAAASNNKEFNFAKEPAAASTLVEKTLFEDEQHVADIKPASYSFDSSIGLEPMNEAPTDAQKVAFELQPLEENEPEEVKPIKAKPKKVTDDDDIEFTGPESWTLS